MDRSENSLYYLNKTWKFLQASKFLIIFFNATNKQAFHKYE